MRLGSPSNCGLALHWLVIACVVGVSPSHAALPNDPDLPSQWALINTGQTIELQDGVPDADIDMEIAWAIHEGDPSTVVAIVGSGVTPHPEFEHRLLEGRSFVGDFLDTRDACSNGTPIAGIIAAASNNGLGMAGIAPRIRLLPVRVGACTTSEALTASGIVWAVDQGVGVILVPLTLSTGSQVLADAIDYAAAHDVLVVAPVGNGGNNEVLFPAAFSSCLAVSSTNNQDLLSSGSNYGTAVDLSAPGGNIWTTLSGGGFAFRSFPATGATHVAGVAALVRSLAPQLSADGVRAVLLASADDLGDAGPDDRFGAGRLNAGRALTMTPLPPLRFEVLDPLPPERAVESPITVRILDGAGQLLPGTPRAWYRTRKDRPFESALLHSGPDRSFVFDIPDYACRHDLEFYFHATSADGLPVTTPWSAPAEAYRIYIISADDVFFDDFETDRGWTTEILPDIQGGLIAGAWFRGVPETSMGQSRFDHTPDPGQTCFVTGRTAGVDVDYGHFFLDSPAIEVPEGDFQVDFAAWVYSSGGFRDDLHVVAALDSGLYPIVIQSIPADSPATIQWREHRFRIRQPNPAGGTLYLRFAIRDAANDSITEAAVDDFRVRRIVCPSPLGDLNASGEVDLADFRVLFDCFAGPANSKSTFPCVTGDIDGNGAIDLRDVARIQADFGSR